MQGDLYQEIEKEEFQATRIRSIANGYLYCFTSSWMPSNTYKIGCTENLANRFAQYNTYHLNPRFVITSPKCEKSNEHYCRGKNEPLSTIDVLYYRESAVHKILQPYRCVSNREFFECTLDQVVEAFNKVEAMNQMECIAFLSDIQLLQKSDVERLQEENTSLVNELSKIQSINKEYQETILYQNKNIDKLTIASTDLGAKMLAQIKYDELKKEYDELKQKSLNYSKLQIEIDELKNNYQNKCQEKEKDVQSIQKEKEQFQLKVKTVEKNLNDQNIKYQLLKDDFDILIKEFKKIQEEEKINNERKKNNKDYKVSSLYYLTPKNNTSLPNKNKCEDIINALLSGWNSILIDSKCIVETSKDGEKKVFITYIFKSDCKDKTEVKKEAFKIYLKFLNISNQCWKALGAECFVEETGFDII